MKDKSKETEIKCKYGRVIQPTNIEHDCSYCKLYGKCMFTKHIKKDK